MIVVLLAVDLVSKGCVERNHRDVTELCHSYATVITELFHGSSMLMFLPGAGRHGPVWYQNCPGKARRCESCDYLRYILTQLAWLEIYRIEERYLPESPIQGHTNSRF